MKKLAYWISALSIAGLLYFLPGCGSDDAKGKSDAAGLSAELKKNIDPELAKNFEAVITDLKDDPESIKLLGHYAYLNRNPELASWLYALASEKKPDDYLNLANLGTTLNEIYLTGNEKDPEMLKKSLDLLRRAAEGAKNNAGPQNNLGYALFRQYQETNDAALLTEAETFLRKAVALEPSNATALSHLAEVLAALDKTE
jgi:Flp pilus assembly protein TadD